MGLKGSPSPRGAEDKIRDRYTIFEALCITGVNPTHTPTAKFTSEESTLVGITATLQFTRTHPLEPLDVTPDGGEVVVSVLGDGYNILDPNAPHVLISCEDLVIYVFGSPNWRQQVGREVDARLDGLVTNVRPRGSTPR